MLLSGRELRHVGWPLRAAILVSSIVVLSLSLRIALAEPGEATAVPIVAAALSNADAVSIEQRLDRLEKMVEALTSEVRAIREAQSAQTLPIVVKTVPEAGAKDVDPDLTEIKVTFNKDMQDGSWSWTNRGPDTFPLPGDGKIHYEQDNRTCVFPCKLEPGKTYWIGINSARFKNFTDKSGHPAKPYELTFTTKE